MTQRYDDEGLLISVNRLAGQRVYVFSNSDYRMYHANVLKSATMTTDQTGTVIEDQLFYPWGQKWYDEGTSTGYRFFAGMKQQDWKTGNDPALHRDYNPGLGRWLTPDPGGMKVIHLDNPQTWNLYAYVTNNPETLNDPLGLSGGNDAFEYFNPSTCSKQDGGCAGGNSADQKAGTQGGKKKPFVIRVTVRAAKPIYDPPIVSSQDPFSFLFLTLFTGGADELFDFGTDTLGSEFEGDASTAIEDATNPGSIPNLKAGTTPDQFGQTLEENGYTKTTTQDGHVQYTKGDKTYTIYTSKNGTPSVQVKVGGTPVSKIRLNP